VLAGLCLAASASSSVEYQAIADAAPQPRQRAQPLSAAELTEFIDGTMAIQLDAKPAAGATISVVKDGALLLGKEIIIQVVDKFVAQLEAQLMDRNVHIELTPAAAEWLADKGYDDKMGARPLARVIQEHIKKPLAEELLFGKLMKGGLVRVSLKDDALALEVAEPERPRITSKKPPLLTAD
jgi:hypothetical protein